jgi:hypothetical protein
VTEGAAGITGRAGGCAIGRTRPRLSVALATTRPVLRGSQKGLDGVGTFPRAVSLVAFVGPRSGDGAAARTEDAAASTDAGCAQAVVRPGEDCSRLEQCLMTPGTHGIFQC